MTPARRLAPTLALGAVAAAAVVAYARVFSGGSWALPGLSAAALSMALTRWGLRPGGRLQRHGFVLGSLIAIAGAWFVILVVFPGTTVAGIPGLASIQDATRAIHTARSQMSTITAPIVPTPGFNAIVAGVAWFAGAMSVALLGRDPRSGGPTPTLTISLLAPLPWAVVFTAAAGVGAGPGRATFAAAFFAALLCFLLVDSWASHGRFPSLRRAVPLGAVSLVAALVLPSVVPGASSGPLLPWAQLGPQTQTTISPLVQIQPLLLNKSNTNLFQVTASQPAYWRLTALDRFDGNAWSSAGSYRAASGTLAKPPAGVASQALQQSYLIQNLGGIWVPAAYEAAKVSSGLRAGHDDTSQTLIVNNLNPLTRYTITSDLPEPTADQLASASAALPPGPDDLALPPATVALIRPIAESVAGGAGTPYQRALALQTYLRGFTYNAAVPLPAAGGSSDRYLYSFLTVIKQGYCEQFAGAMAVMLRILGIPARVAVGFLPGQPNGTTYEVKGADAHAWPEAHFSGVGWVAFEPTPRSDATTPPYAAGPQPTEPSPTEASPQPTEVPAASPSPTEVPAAVPVPPRHHANAFQQAVTDGLVVLMLVVLLLVGARETRLRLPGRRAGSARERAMAAYWEFSLRAADAYTPRQAGETEAEYADALVATLDLVPAEVGAVTSAYQTAAYAAHPPSGAQVDAALAANQALRRHLFRQASWRGRTRLGLSARPLITRSRRIPAARSPRSPRGPGSDQGSGEG